MDNNHIIATELRNILIKYNRDQAWYDFPDHMVMHYVQAYLMCSQHKDAAWYKELYDAYIEHIILDGGNNG